MHNQINDVLTVEQKTQIMKFYQVSNEQELIKALNDHVKKLQGKLASVQPKPYEVPLNYRHG